MDVQDVRPGRPDDLDDYIATFDEAERAELAAVEAAIDKMLAITPLTRDFLAWIVNTPRTYAEAMEAWRSSCPRLTIWEDALDAGLFRVERAGNQRLSECLVALTPRGRALLEGRISL